MKIFVGLILILSSFTVFADSPFKSVSRTQVWNLNRCPDTFEEWTTWRQYITQTIPNRSRFWNNRERIRDKVRECLTAQQSSTTNALANASIAQCMSRIDNFLIDINYSYVQTPQENSYTEIPNFFQGQSDADDRMQAFLRQAARYSGATQAANELNTYFQTLPEPRPVAARYSSRHIGAAYDGEAKDRVVVYVPGNPAKYIQFTMRGPNDTPGSPPRRGNTINVISVYDPPGDAPRRTYFRDYKRKYTAGRIEIEPAPADKHMGCVRCHKGGPHDIVPRNAYGFEDEIEQINRGIVPNWRSVPRYNPENWGPQIGDELKNADGSSVRDSQFFETCTQGVTGIPGSNPQRQEWFNDLALEMDCTGCHEDDSRVGALRFPYGLAGTGGHMLERFIGTGEMPQYSTLNDSQRKALIQCLRYEFYGRRPNGSKDPNFNSAMDRWATNVSCSPIINNGNKGVSPNPGAQHTGPRGNNGGSVPPDGGGNPNIPIPQ